MQLFFAALSLVGLIAASGQLSQPNTTGVAMGHLHYHVKDVEANRKFWVALGGQATHLGAMDVIKFPGVLVMLEAGPSSGGTAGSIVNHVAFRVQSFAKVEEAGFKVGTTRTGSSDYYDEEVVIKQDPAAETPTAPGTPVNLVLNE